ncbi:MAG: pyridoxamine 5'-phosphate oxidase family protein [Proteobacteria bacterium]|nr:pyridoxamine 5'-phosphate oxidase family protein [Pseudomonadota bacterium]MBU4469055.1 pyridoxamine 5'-phosphate oxidase family protein [Pseudomonadota bacterium]MCG2751027.1 pyridoxamine 5'-phosphate oxidase family protein [Desulfobacteraceae bacterium]
MHYHMRRKDREITDRIGMIAVIRTGKFAVIALCKESEPYLVTMSYGFDEATETFYFHGAKQGQKIEFLKANPKVCLTVIEDKGYQHGHCTHAYRSVVVRGKMLLVDDLEERVKAIRIMIDQLETDKTKYFNMVDDPHSQWPGTRMFKLKIEAMTCKERPPVA